MGYPFRFYGRVPTDWKGAELPAFSVQFCEAPSEATRRALAREWVLMTTGTVIRADQKQWRWSGRFVEIGFEVRWSRDRAALRAFTDFLMGARHLAPIRDVIYLNALDADGRWDRWSLEQQAPDPGPAGWVAGCHAFRREVDETLPAHAIDAAFEAAVAEAIVERNATRVRRAIDKMKNEAVRLVATPISVDDPRAKFQSIVWPDAVLQAFAPPDPATERRTTARSNMTVRRAGHHMLERAADAEAPVAIRVDDDGASVAFVTQNADQSLCEHAFEPALEAKEELRERVAHANGSAFVATSRGVRKLDERVATTIWQSTHEHGVVLGINALTEDRLLVVTEQKLVVLDLDGQLITQRANTKGRANAWVSTAEVSSGALIASTGWDKPAILSLFVADRIEKVGQIPKGLRVFPTLAGTMLVVGPDAVFALEGLDDAVRVLEAKAAKKRSKKKRTKKAAADKPPAPRLESIELGDVPSVEDAAGFEAAERVAFPKRASLARTDDGARVAAAIPGSNDHGAPQEERSYRLLVRDADGTITNHTALLEQADNFYADAVDIAPSGDRVVSNSRHDVYEFDLARSAVSKIWRYDRNASHDVRQILSAQILDEHRVLILGETGLVLLRDGEVQHRVKLSKCAQLVVLREHQICAVRGTGATRLTLFAVGEHKLVKLYADKSLDIGKLLGADGLLFATNRKEAWMLMGAEAAAAYALR